MSGLQAVLCPACCIVHAASQRHNVVRGKPEQCNGTMAPIHNGCARRPGCARTTTTAVMAFRFPSFSCGFCMLLHGAQTTSLLLPEVHGSFVPAPTPAHPCAPLLASYDAADAKEGVFGHGTLSTLSTPSTPSLSRHHPSPPTDLARPQKACAARNQACGESARPTHTQTAWCGDSSLFFLLALVLLVPCPLLARP